MIKFAKRLFIKLFTTNPYHILRFKELYTDKVGIPIDSAESSTGIILKEAGASIYYSGFPATFQQTFNLRKIEGELRYLPSGLFVEPNRYVYSLSNANIYGSLGIIYSKEKRAFIEESAKEWLIDLKNSSYTNIYKLPKSNLLTGISLSFLSNGADGGYYHFMHEVLPKLWLCRNLLPYTNHLFFNAPVTDWKLKWLNFLNIDINRIIWVGPYDNYKCEQLLFTSMIIKDQQLSHYSITALKSLIGSGSISNNKPQKVVFISRTGERERDLKWEDDLLNHYPDFQKINASNLSVEETIDYFESATIIIAAHGAGLSNLFLCSPNTKVLELYPDLDHYQPCYTRISDICELKHHVAAIDFNQRDNKTMGMGFLTSVIDTLIARN